jgi:hypothetical protein
VGAENAGRGAEQVDKAVLDHVRSHMRVWKTQQREEICGEGAERERERAERERERAERERGQRERERAEREREKHLTQGREWVVQQVNLLSLIHRPR